MDTQQDRSLNRLQNWMQTVITHPQGVVGGVDSNEARQHVDVDHASLQRVILPSRSRTSVERLEVYSFAYVTRLLECLSDEFPATAAAFGEDAFNSLAFDYLQAFPPHSYTLAELGATFPAFLDKSRPTDTVSQDEFTWTDFLVDLATLERTYAEVFDCPGPESTAVLEHAAIASVPPEIWPRARLIAFPCVKVLSLNFPVHEFSTAIRQSVDQPELPAARPVFLVISRRDFVVRRREISATQFALLQAILDGAAIETAVAVAAEQSDDSVEVLASNLSDWFQSWTESTFFSGIEFVSED